MSLALAMRRRAMKVAAGGPLVSDSFNRPDSTTTLGNADTGQAWTNFGTGMAITSNQAHGPSAAPGEHGAVIDAGAANVSVVFTLSGGTTSSSGPAGRWSDINNFWRFDLNQANGSWRLLKRAAGTYTQPASGTTTERGVMKLVMSASPVSCHVNSVQLGSVNDPFGAGVTKHGMFAEHASHRFDDFKVELL